MSFQCPANVFAVFWLIQCSCVFAIFTHFFLPRASSRLPFSHAPLLLSLFITSVSTLPSVLQICCFQSIFDTTLSLSLSLFFSLSLCIPYPDTSPPPSLHRPTPRPGGRAPPDPLPSVSAAPQQIGGMVWDFLGKWVLCPGTSARLRA